MLRLADVRRAVLVVAHPDDETLWCGGLLASTAEQIEWTVICCSTPRRDPIRVEKFAEACQLLGVRHRIVSAWEETPPPQPLTHLERFLSAQRLSAYDLLVTHGTEGEYGHVHHRQLNRYLTARQTHVVTIAMRPTGSQSPGQDFALAPAVIAKKLSALHCYDHVLPYRGRPMPKWEALLLEYGKTFDLETERYDGFSR